MLVGFSLGLFTACGPAEVGTIGPVGETHAPVSASAVFESKQGSPTVGTMKFIQAEDGVLVAAVLSGLPPGEHGVHLHEKGVCAAPDYASAGDHFNPTNQPHACPPDKERHAGDLGNIEVDAEGNGRFELRTDLLTVGDGPSTVVGRAVIIHDMKDDCTTHPSGDSGMRLSCAVVQMK
jgi:Cu-Zn family superoxide dismutase